MTREVAIDLLDNLIGMIEDNHGADYDTALHMAINSLKADDAYQLEYEHIPTITITVEEYIRLRERENKPRGKWITLLNEVYRCSKCETEWRHQYNYCPFCGARMMESEE